MFRLKTEFDHRRSQNMISESVLALLILLRILLWTRPEEKWKTFSESTEEKSMRSGFELEGEQL